MRLLHAGLRHVALRAVDDESPNPSDAEIEKALQGNLCRCTGYEAIVRAAEAISSYGKAAKDPLAAERKAITARLAAMRDGSRVEIGDGQAAADRAGLGRRSRRRCSTPSRRPRIVAGSTDVGLWVTKYMRDISPAVFIGELDELQTISEDERRHHASAPASPTPRPSRRSPSASRRSGRCSTASAASRCATWARSAATSPTARRSATRRRR